jgi:acetate kinase
MKNPAILVVNAGSSSIKCSLFACSKINPSLDKIYHLDMTGIGTRSQFIATDAKGNRLIQQDLKDADHDQAFSILLSWLEQHDDGLNLIAVGHRVVHGGTQFSAPVALTQDIFKQLEQLIPLAPLHQPHNLAPIKTLTKLKPHLLQVACFDTAFHATQPAVAQLFAIPHSLTEMGIKRYGFHGLSYEYIAHSLPHYLGEMPHRVIVAHLGNGASMAALQDGRSIATTMGFTALDGLPMGTRCGMLDPGVILHLLKEGMDLKTLTNLLYHQSGLLGVSGLSNDMRELLDSDAPSARQAIDLFVYRLGRELGSLVATLGGLDTLIFTAGIGQHAAPIRARICEDATWLGVQLDVRANQQHGPKISTSNSQVSVWVIPTDEEQMIAKHTYNIMENGKWKMEDG